MQKVILKAKQWIGKLLGAEARDSGEERPAGRVPGQDVHFAVPGPKLWTARTDSPSSNPPPVYRSDPEPREVDPSVFVELRESIMECAFPRMSVEKRMVNLCSSYRSSMPPCQLQLFPWAYPKGSPPRVVYWVRLLGKKNEFNHASLLRTPSDRPRWFKVLRIRTRTDLHNAIYWNGLCKHRSTVMSFYDSWWALNKSHSILAKAMQYAKHALKFHMVASGPGNEDSTPLLRTSSRAYMGRAGEGLLLLAWRMGWLVERTLNSLEELRKRTANLPFRLVLSEGSRKSDRVIQWEHGLSGRRYHVLRKNSLKIRQLSPQDAAAVILAVNECNALRKTLSKQLGIILRTERRLGKARLESDEALERYAPPQRLPWVQGY